jgi:hypothetical protein
MNKTHWQRKIGRVVSQILVVSGSALALVTSLWQRLEVVGRSDAVLKVIDLLPGWLNSPIAGVVAVLGGYGLLWVYARPIPKKPSVIILPGHPEEETPVSARKLGAVSALSGLALGALIIGVFWLVPSQAVFTVTVEKGQSVTAENDPRRARNAHDGKSLTITLLDLEQTADTQKYLITATVSYEGKPDLPIRKAEEGYVVAYPEEHGYTIRLFKATANNATFLVSKNP